MLDKRSKYTLFSVLALLAVGLVWFIFSGTSGNQEQVPPAPVKPDVQNTSSGSTGEAGLGEKPELPEDDIKLDAVERAILKLRELLDDEDKQDEAIAMATEMAGKSYSERLAAIDVFEWTGGAEAKKALFSLISAKDDTSERAKQVLSHILAEEQIFEKPVEEDFWIQTLETLDSDSRDSYFVILTGNPVSEYFPVLLKLYDSDNKELKKSAEDYITSTMGEIDFEGIEKARIWFEKYLAEEKENE